jgi:hypothetical protein
MGDSLHSEVTDHHLHIQEKPNYDATKNHYQSLKYQYHTIQDQYQNPSDQYPTTQGQYQSPVDQYHATKDIYQSPVDQYLDLPLEHQTVRYKSKIHYPKKYHSMIAYLKDKAKHKRQVLVQGPSLQQLTARARARQLYYSDLQGRNPKAARWKNTLTSHIGLFQAWPWRPV